MSMQAAIAVAGNVTTGLSFGVFSSASRSHGAASTSSLPAASSKLTLKSFCGFKADRSSRSGVCSFRGGDSFETLTASLRSVEKKNKSETANVGQARASAYKVAILGAAGGIGQPLSLLIKMSPLVSHLNLYDIANVKGVVADLSHCNTPAQVY
jgi:malate dehydrogenase